MRKLLKKSLCRENIFLDLEAENKTDVIREMIEGLCSHGLLRDREAALDAVTTRERKMSTGMKYGVAIPHGKTDSVDHLVVAVGIKPAGLDFECADGEPARIFIMTISPANRTGPHIQFLAEVSKVLRRAELREGLVKAGTPEDVISIFI